MAMQAVGKLSGPEFIPTAAPVPRPETKLPRMTGVPKFDDKEPEARRVSQSDFVEFGTWLLPKLAERYGRPPESLVGYLRFTATDRHHAFFRHKDAALLVLADTVQLEASPVVREIFGRIRATKADSQEIRQAQQAQLIELYRLASEWAQSIKALYFRFGEETDLPQAARYDALSNSVKRDYHIQPLR